MKTLILNEARFKYHFSNLDRQGEGGEVCLCPADLERSDATIGEGIDDIFRELLFE